MERKKSIVSVGELIFGEKEYLVLKVITFWVEDSFWSNWAYENKKNKKSDNIHETGLSTKRLSYKFSGFFSNGYPWYVL